MFNSFRWYQKTELIETIIKFLSVNESSGFTNDIVPRLIHAVGLFEWYDCQL